MSSARYSVMTEAPTDVKGKERQVLFKLRQPKAETQDLDVVGFMKWRGLEARRDQTYTEGDSGTGSNMERVCGADEHGHENAG